MYLLLCAIIDVVGVGVVLRWQLLTRVTERLVTVAGVGEWWTRWSGGRAGGRAGERARVLLCGERATRARCWLGGAVSVIAFFRHGIQ